MSKPKPPPAPVLCQDCGAIFERSSRKGVPPMRCAACGLARQNEMRREDRQRRAAEALLVRRPLTCLLCPAAVTGRATFCPTCKQERKRTQGRLAAARWREGNLELARQLTRASMTRYRTDHRDKHNAQKRLWAYNMTPAQLDEIRAAQDYKCAICGVNESDSPKGLFVDHDHACCPGTRSCGKCVRALLCPHCNTAVGYMNDDPARLRAAADYLERHADG